MARELTDAEAAEQYRKAMARYRKAPRCEVCKRPMILGQLGRHQACR